MTSSLHLLFCLPLLLFPILGCHSVKLMRLIRAIYISCNSVWTYIQSLANLVSLVTTWRIFVCFVLAQQSSSSRHIVSNSNRVGQTLCIDGSETYHSYMHYWEEQATTFYQITFIIPTHGPWCNLSHVTLYEPLAGYDPHLTPQTSHLEQDL